MADEQMRAAQVAMQLAPIKSNDQLQRYLTAYPKDLSAFQGVPTEVVEQFASSLTFNGKGLTGFDPTPLKALSPSQVYKILALFGLQSGAGRIAAAPRNQLDADVNLAPQGLGESVI